MTNASWGGRLSPGAFADFEFQVDYSAGSGRPQQCALDGGSCAGPGMALNKAVPASVPAGLMSPPTTARPPPPVPGSAVFGPCVDLTLQPEDLAALASASGTQALRWLCGLGGGLFPGLGWLTPVGSPSDYAKSAIPAFVRPAVGSSSRSAVRRAPNWPSLVLL